MILRSKITCLIFTNKFPNQIFVLPTSNYKDILKYRMEIFYMGTYADEIKKQNILKLRDLLDKMPPFCTDYFRGISGSKAERTRVGYCRNIYTFLQFITQVNPLYQNVAVKNLPLSVLDEMTPSDIDEYKEYLRYYEIDGVKYQNSEPTIARNLSAISNMYSFFNKRQAVKNNPLNAVERPKLHNKVIVTLDQEQIFALMDAVDNTDNMSTRQKKLHDVTVDRDRAILSVFLGTGMRVSELAGLDIADIDFKNQTFRVVRKGGNEEFVYFGEEIYDALMDYLLSDSSAGDIKTKSPREALLKENSDEKALFLSLRGTRMAVRSIEAMVKKYSNMLQTNKKITPHKLRSTYGTALYKETGDIYLVADVLGHKDVNTTKKHYADQNNENRKRAANIVSLKREFHSK